MELLKINKILTAACIKYMHTEKYFSNACALFENRYEIPSRRTLVRNLEKKKIEIEARVKEDIKSCENVAITHDSWTSLNTESYSTVTVHYIEQR